MIPRRTTKRRAAVAAVLLALVAVVVSGCAPEVDASWQPTGWPASPVAVVGAPPPLDAATVPGLDADRIRNDAVGIQARFSSVPGPLRESVYGIVRAAIAQQSAVSGAGYAPAVFPRGTGLGDRACVPGSTLLPAEAVLADVALGPAGGTGTAVVCDVVAAAGPFVGERVRVVTGGPESVASDVSTLLYADTVGGAVVTGEGLWVEGAAQELWDDVVEALRREAGSLTLAPVAALTEEQRERIAASLAGTLVADDGSLVFTIAPGFETAELAALGVPATTEPLTIGVPPGLLSELATEFGLALSAAVAAGEPFAPPVRGLPPVDCTLVPCVALTYDDGPSNLTPALLDTLRDARTPATFFMLGQNAAGRPDTVRRVAAEGHEIGGHSWNHPDLTTLDDDAVAWQTQHTRQLLQDMSGQAVATFRPPYGEYDQRVLNVAGLPAILWSVDTRDWAGPADDALVAEAVDVPHPGGIVLMHDIHERTVRLAPDIIAGLRDRGFSGATITQLFRGDPPTSGAWRAAG